jgi:hypothetical protein
MSPEIYALACLVCFLSGMIAGITIGALVVWRGG